MIIKMSEEVDNITGFRVEDLQDLLWTVMGCCMSTSEEWHGYGKSSRKHDWKSSRKRRAKLVLAAEARQEEQLLLFPGRLYGNGSSNIASLYTQQGKKGINQDAMLLWQDFRLGKDTVFCGVFDGHGPHGHWVAAKVRDTLPSKLLAHFEASVSPQSNKKVHFLENGDEVELPSEVEDEYDEQMRLCWADAHLQACRMMDKELRVHPRIDCYCSGTTAVTILREGRNLIIANIGDSRAVLATKADDDSIYAIQLTIDLKPNLPEEAERIRRCKGRVFPLNDEPDVHRVWLPHNNTPGLAMARAFGDFCLKDYGVIGIPEITYRRISDRDQFIILATDGVWDVLSNQEAVDIICSASSRSTAARDLVECAVETWKVKYPTSKVDDCAVVCLYIDDVDALMQYSNHHEIEDGLYYTKEFVTSNKPEHKELATIEAFINNVETVLEDEHLLSAKMDSEQYEWSALEGVARANSLLNLPRYVPGLKIGGAQAKAVDIAHVA